MVRKKINLALLGFLLQFSCIGQYQNGPIKNPGENGTSNNVQNNLFDGTANISIPFFSKTIDGIDISINASYNTKGIKVDQMASEIGLGWNLEYGGYIQRTVKGLPDDLYFPAQTCTANSLNFPWPELSGSNVNCGVNLTKPDIDLELDEYQLAIPGMNVKFFIDRAGDIYTIPKSNIKIQRTYNSTIYSGTLVMTYPIEFSFRVTDEKGNIYFFEPGDRKEYKSLPVNQSCPVDKNYIPVSWVMKKIVTNDGQQIVYQYYSRQVQDIELGTVQGVSEYFNVLPHVIPNTETFKYTGYLAQIRQIEFPDNTTVYFKYNTTYPRCDVLGTYALNEIQIEDVMSDPGWTTNPYSSSYSYMFNYEYFHSSLPSKQFETAPFASACNSISVNANIYSNIDSKELRLKLLSIDRVGSNNTHRLYYSFSYLEGMVGSTNLNMPPRLNYQQDYFGYYNNHPTIVHHPLLPSLDLLVPKHTLTGTNDDYGIDMTPDYQYAKAFLLNKVKNGMGGETEFYYIGGPNYGYQGPGVLSNAFSSIYNYNDGLILYQKVDRDGYSVDNEIRTNYYHHTGFRFLPAGLFHNNTVRCENFFGSNQNYNFTDYFNSCLSAHQIINGSNHGFSEVTVETTDHSQNVIGRTDYLFSNVTGNPSGYGVPASNILNLSDPISDPTSFNKQYNEAPYSNKPYFRNWAVGLPLEITVYDYNNKITSKVKNIYSVSPDIYSPNSANVSTKKAAYSFDCDGAAFLYNLDRYYPVSGTARLIQSINSKDLSDNDISSTSTQYNYVTNNNYDYLRDIKTSGLTNGEELQQKYFYTWDWTNFGSPPPGLNYLLQHDINTVLLTETWKKVNGTYYLLNGGSQGLALLSSDKVRSKYNYIFGSNNGITSANYASGIASFNVATASSGGTIPNYQLTCAISNFDEYYNPRETVGLNSDYVVTFFDKKKKHLIAQIENARINDVAYSSFEYDYLAKGTQDDNKCNWDFDPLSVVPNSTLLYPEISGRYLYKLDPAKVNQSKILSKNNLQNGVKYVLTFWAKGGDNNSFVVKNNGSAVTMNDIEYGRGGWMQYYVEFNGSAGAITIEAAGSQPTYIDELRLYPYGAKMSTSVYAPGVGKIAVCNDNNRFTYYEYDEFYNNVLVRNHWDRILSKKEYKFQEND